MNEENMSEQTTKVCTMCGQVKPQEDFRRYPNGKRYPYCLDCQTIETRRRYLSDKNVLTDAECQELQSIEKLYEKRVEKGLKTFGMRSKNDTVKDLVAKQMEALGKE